MLRQILSLSDQMKYTGISINPQNIRMDEETEASKRLNDFLIVTELVGSLDTQLRMRSLHLFTDHTTSTENEIHL